MALVYACSAYRQVAQCLIRPCLIPFPHNTHGVEFVRLLAERILVLDGAMGTMIQQYKLGEKDFRGTRLMA